MSVRRRPEVLAPPPIDDPVLASLPTLEPLEVHSGVVMGGRRSPALEPVPEWGPPTGVDEALERILVPALERRPCLVAFSGGRDSSAVLAIAADLARRHGLDPPVPITLRYDDPRTWETEWQEEVVSHLGLRDWEIIDVGNEFDMLGELARWVLVRHGLYWPSNAHTLIPLLRAPGSGTLLTGNGGDEVFNALVRPKKMTPRQMFHYHPPHIAFATLVVSFLPLPLKIRVQYARTLRLPWLRRSAMREVMRRFVAQSIERRREKWGYLKRFADSRYLELANGVFQAIARDVDAALVQPFLDPRFIDAVRHATPEQGYLGRGATMEAFFGRLLPRRVTHREGKARFTDVFWGPESRAFASAWDGEGLDPSLVDPDRLRATWARPRPDFRATTPLQAAWLASRDSI